MNKILTLITLFFFISIASAQSDSISKMESLSEEEFSKKLSQLDNDIKLDSTNFELYMDRGYQYFQNKLIDEALDDFNKALELNPRSHIGYHYRAVLFYTIGYADYAIKDNTQAILLSDNDTLTNIYLNNRGNAKMMKQDFQGAYDDYLTVLKFDSTDLAALTSIGTTLNGLNRDEEAIEYLETVIRLYPKSYGGYVNLAYKYMLLEDYQKALDLNNKALEIDSLQPNAYNNRGFVHYKLKNNEAALNDINKSLNIYPNNSYAYKNRSLVYIEQDKLNLACLDMEKAIEFGFSEMYGTEVKELQNKYCSE
jgi:tetratricopeptide (TPR) repeat protein